MSIITGNLIHKPIIVTIRGNVGTGKTPWATRLGKLVEQAGYKVDISDYEVYAGSKSYKHDYDNVVNRIRKHDYDMGIIVVTTQPTEERNTFSIQIEPAITAPMDILFLLSGSTY
jgi:uridine kinase